MFVAGWERVRTLCVGPLVVVVGVGGGALSFAWTLAVLDFEFLGGVLLFVLGCDV